MEKKHTKKNEKETNQLNKIKKKTRELSQLSGAAISGAMDGPAAVSHRLGLAGRLIT